MSEVNLDRHVFGENPGTDPNPHESSKLWNEAKTALQAEQRIAEAALRERHQRERTELADSFRERYQQASKAAGFR